MSVTYLTIKGKTDGFGAQYQAILSGIAYCKYKNYTYIHTPFAKMEHNTDIIKANEFIGIKTNSKPSNISIKEKHYIEKVHLSATPSIYYTDKVLEYIRKRYYSTEKPSIDEIDIAIHIRRGDVSKDENKERFIQNSIYVEIINKLKEKHPIYNITVFSEGKYEDFKELGLEEGCFRLNMDIFKTFHCLVSAKILITCISSFSYCAGIINNNTVYHYDTFDLKKLNNWLKISDLIGNHILNSSSSSSALPQ
jgi:hypothetical protein